MKIRCVALVLGFVLSSCEKPKNELVIGSDLQDELIRIQQDRDLTDEEMRDILQEWVSAEQIAMREDLWGADGLDAFAINVAEEMKEQMQEFETMSMLSEVFILEYLQRDDVDGAKEHLRSNIASRYRKELQEGTPRDDSMIARVEKLAAEDPILGRMIRRESSGEQGADDQLPARAESEVE